MVAHLPTETITEVIYPECDGKPISDSTKQFRWIVTIKENLELLYANDPNVFVAGDLLWYPVEGNNSLCQAPDVLVAIRASANGRPKGDRGSYQQWQEGDIAPQVVFEILSPSNRLGEMSRKLEFYDRHGVEEYYVYDPDRVDFTAWMRSDGRLALVDFEGTWTSPLMGIRFELTPQDLMIYRSDGQPFLGFVEMDRQRQRAEALVVESARLVEAADQRADRAEEQAAKLAAKLRELGIDPSSL